MPKQEAWKGRKEVFAWYLLRFKRFRGVTKFNEKWTSKCHEKSMKTDTLGTIGVDCWDFGVVFGGPRILCFLWFFQSIQKLTKICKKSKNEAKAMPREARARCRSMGVNPGKVHRAVRGGPLLAPSSVSLDWSRASLERIFPMPIFTSFFVNILATFWPPKAPKVHPKTSQNASRNRSQN